MIVRWRNGHKNQRQSEKISSWQSPWLHRDLQILWIKSLPFQIRTSLWSNKAVLTTHFLTSPLMFCSNLVVGAIRRDLSPQAQTPGSCKLVPWNFIKQTNVFYWPRIRRKPFNVFVSFKMITLLLTTICKNLTDGPTSAGNPLSWQPFVNLVPKWSNVSHFHLIFALPHLTWQSY